MIDLLQWAGCLTGVLGAALLAARTRLSGWGFVAYLLSNCFWIAYALATAAPGLLVMQCAFMLTSLVGVWRWLLPPFRHRWPALLTLRAVTARRTP